MKTNNARNHIWHNAETDGPMPHQDVDGQWDIIRGFAQENNVSGNIVYILHASQETGNLSKPLATVQHYCGSTVNFWARMYSHCHGNKTQGKLVKHWNKLGIYWEPILVLKFNTPYEARIGEKIVKLIVKNQRRLCPKCCHKTNDRVVKSVYRNLKEILTEEKTVEKLDIHDLDLSDFDFDREIADSVCV